MLLLLVVVVFVPLLSIIGGAPPTHILFIGMRMLGENGRSVSDSGKNSIGNN